MFKKTHIEMEDMEDEEEGRTVTVSAPPKLVTLNEDQAAAQEAILAAYKRGEREFLLIGAAGVGKTTLMQSLCVEFSKISIKRKYGLTSNVRPVVTAPTHKAVAVLSRKMDEANIHVASMTIHSLLGL